MARDITPEQSIRFSALSYALEMDHDKTVRPTAHSVVADAKVFEDYLRGPAPVSGETETKKPKHERE